MTNILASAVFAVLAAALTMHSISPEAVARHVAVEPSFDIAMPSAPESADTRLVTALDGAGAARSE